MFFCLHIAESAQYRRNFGNIELPAVHYHLKLIKAATTTTAVVVTTTAVVPGTNPTEFGTCYSGNSPLDSGSTGASR